MHSMQQKSIPQLTGIRAIAAIGVVLFHLGGDLATLLPASKVLNRFIHSGYLGVDIFFVLSGFILAYNYLLVPWSFHTYKNFLWLRLARIYPVHLFTLLLLVPIVLREHFFHIEVQSAIDTSMQAWFANVGLLQGWPALVHNTSWNFPAWTISDEWSMYLLFPLLTIWLGRKKLAVPMLWLCFAGCFALLILIYRILPDPGNPIQTGLPRILCEFTAGVILFLLFKAPARIPASPALLALLTCALAALLAGRLRIAICTVPVFALLLLRLAQGESWLSRILAWRWLVYGGEASYSLYMTHAFSLLLLTKFLPSARFAGTHLYTRLGVLAIYVATICALAVLTFEWIEKPCRRWMRNAARSAPEPTLPVTGSNV